MEGARKRLWTVEEDEILMEHIRLHGKGKWNRAAKTTGLKRCGKSCRLRWLNYLSPDVQRGHFSEQEDDLIIRLHKLLGNRWALIAGRVPGRTDNQVKNYWNVHLGKKAKLSTENTTVGLSSSSLSQVFRETEELPDDPSAAETPSEPHGGLTDEEVRGDISGSDALDDSGPETLMRNDYIDGSFMFPCDMMSEYLPNLFECVEHEKLFTMPVLPRVYADVVGPSNYTLPRV